MIVVNSAGLVHLPIHIYSTRNAASVLAIGNKAKIRTSFSSIGPSSDNRIKTRRHGSRSVYNF
jgi:hypothetical protein